MRYFLLCLMMLVLVSCGGRDRAVTEQETDALTREGRETLRQQVLGGIPPADETLPQEDGLVAALPPQARGYGTIALLAPFTGDESPLGDSLLNAALLAVFENPQVRVNLFSPDSAGNIEQAFQQAQQHQAQAIIGPVRATEAQAIARAAQRYRVPIFSLSNSLNIGGGFIYPTGPAPEGQIPVALEYLQKRGNYSLAVLAPDNRYGRLIREQVRAYNNDKRGVFYITDFLYPPDIRDFTPFIAQIAAVRPQAILLAPTQSQNLRIMAAQLDSANLAAPMVQIMGLQLWDNFGSLWTEPSLDSAIWVSALSPTADEFHRKYQETFGTVPHPLAGIAYDVTNMILQRYASSGDLADNQQFFGSVGAFSPRANGQIIRRYYLKQINNGRVVFIR